MGGVQEGYSIMDGTINAGRGPGCTSDTQKSAWRRKSVKEIRETNRYDQAAIIQHCIYNLSSLYRDGNASNACLDSQESVSRRVYHSIS